MAKKYRNDLPGSQTMRVGLVLFICWMAYVGYSNEQAAKEGKETDYSLKRYEAIQQFTDTDEWARQVYPSYGKEIRYQEITKGQGDVAACGQKVTIGVTAYYEEGKPIEAFLRPEEPFSFTIGVDAPNEAWGRGVRGMRVGGVRKLNVGARLVYPDTEKPPIKQYEFDIHLLNMEPLASNPAFAFSHSVVQEGLGDGLKCGDEAEILTHIWSASGKLLFTTNDREPITLTLGRSQYGHGFDRGLVGLKHGEIRKLTLPPEYQNQLIEPDVFRIPFPSNEIAIVEVMRVPYKGENASSKSFKEHTHEPERDRKNKPKPAQSDADSQSPERDSAVSDDGSDRKGSGTESSRP